MLVFDDDRKDDLSCQLHVFNGGAFLGGAGLLKGIVVARIKTLASC